MPDIEGNESSGAGGSLQGSTRYVGVRLIVVQAGHWVNTTGHNEWGTP